MRQPYPTTEDFIQFLERKFPTQTIIQTHASLVAIGENYVYKLKKNVNFGFLDFSTLEKRKFYCEEEVRLNQRLSQGIYLEVVPLYLYREELTFEIKGEIVNYAVKMHRMKEENFLINLIERENFEKRILIQLIHKLKKFYETTATNHLIADCGRAEYIQKSVDENFDTIQHFVDEVLCQPTFDSIKKYQYDFLKNHVQDFDARIRAGKIKDCHGDVRAEHIYYHKGEVHLYDCIEFNERFRYIDQLNDLAFLCMDLEHRNHYDYAQMLTKSIIEELKEDSIQQLFNFYKTYRACVRGKVNALRSEEQEVPLASREESKRKAAAYFGLALRYVLLQGKKTLIIVFGGVATGKSTLATYLAAEFNTNHWHSDIVRKDLAGVDLHAHVTGKKQTELYAETMSNKVYETLLHKSLQGLPKEGIAVIDATFREPNFMRHIQQVCEEHAIQLYAIQTIASQEVIRERLLVREEQDEISDMCWQNYVPETFDMAPVKWSFLKNYFMVNTSEADVGQTIEKIYTRMYSQN